MWEGAQAASCVPAHIRNSIPQFERSVKTNFAAFTYAAVCGITYL